MKRTYLSYLCPALSGILLAWAFPAFYWHWLAWVALAPLLLVTASARPAVAAAQFYLCAHVFHSLLLQWLIANIFWAGGWAIIGQQLLCVVLSLFWAVMAYCFFWAKSRGSRYTGPLCVAGIWVAMELMQARLFTGFGWSALGYTQGGNLPVAQWAAVGGVSLVSFVLVLFNALLVYGWLSPERRVMNWAGAVVLLLLAHGGGFLLLRDADYTSKPMRVGVVQPNFSQEMKWDSAYDFDMLQRTAQMTRTLAAHRPIDLAVWPEALIVRHFEASAFVEALTGAAVDSGAHVFTGAVRDEYATSKSFNSSALVTPEGVIAGHYDKVRLAAFGEYIPLESYLPFLGHIAFGGVDPGERQITMPVGDRVLGPLICFETLFAPMAERLRALGADMLVVVTNLAWFGGSNAIAQELEIARMRAIETRLPLIHSANTGISGVFDPYGRFRVVRYTVSPRGDLTDWGDSVKPRHVIMRRFVGDFDLAAPALRPLPFGPPLVPWALAGMGLVLSAMAFVFGTPVETAPAASEKEGKPKAAPKTKRPPKKKVGKKEEER